MEFVDLGIVVLAAVMVWLLYQVTRETRAFTANQKRYALRQAHTKPVRDPGR